VHVLDNPVWHALTGPQRTLGRTTELTGRFDPDVAPFGALVSGSVTDSVWEDLAQLVGPNGTVSLTGDPPDPPSGWTVIARFAGVQMVGDDVRIPGMDVGSSPPGSAESVLPVPMPLGPVDAPEMLALVEVTQPGPFERRTVEFGGYLGIRIGGRLVAMAGERLRPPGYAEISAVATDPNYQRRGLARHLVLAVADGIVRRGDIPFLHASTTNIGAIRLYESLGFTIRRPVVFLLLEAPG
jgi:ribosomal protein S18 acetylase RimI-like enzyme